MLNESYTKLENEVKELRKVKKEFATTQALVCPYANCQNSVLPLSFFHRNITAEMRWTFAHSVPRRPWVPSRLCMQVKTLHEQAGLKDEAAKQQETEKEGLRKKIEELELYV